MNRLILACMLLGAGSAATTTELGGQGVTTSSMKGRITGANGVGLSGAVVSAVHQPSGTAYTALSRSDGRFTIPGMRVGGPYQVTARAIGFERQTRENIFLNLGESTDLAFVVNRLAVQLAAVAVTVQSGAFSSTRTGASTTVGAEALAAFPTIGRTITDFTRLTPQVSGSSFAGQDNRLNNISVDGSYFNNSFGLAGQPGGRTNVSPIPLDAVDQIQVNIAPYDVRQGNFVGAGVNAVTKSGTNDLAGSLYFASRDQGLVGNKAHSATYDPGTFKFAQIGVRLGGPIIRNKLFYFVNYESDGLSQPGTTFLANPDGRPEANNTTRVLEKDLTDLSSFLSSKFNYVTGGFSGYSLKTPSARIIAKVDFNANERNKFSLRYIQLDSKADQLTSNSGSLGNGDRRSNLNSMSFANSGYAILENIKSLVGEWNSQVGSSASNNLIIGYTTNDESRESKGSFFPLVDILKNAITYTSFGFEPFTPSNQLRYKTLQFQDNFTIYTNKHDITFGVTAQKYRSENVFFFGAQSAYVYNSLADFYSDANDFLANPNRTTSPIKLNKFQVSYNNIPGQKEPLQPLEVIYAGAYLQDEWRASRNLKVTAGVRFDVPKFSNTGFANAQVDGLTFRDENGVPAKYSTSKLPDANVLFSPRLGFNWDVRGDRSTQVRGGTGVFTGSPAYVWISNQIGNNGVLTGFEQLTNTSARPFNPNPDAYKPKNVTGAPAASYTLNFTNPDYKFPQLWRSNIAVDQQLPFGIVATGEFLYSKDVNGTYYINANLPAADTKFTGADQRPRWTKNRINPNINGAYVLKNQSVGYSYSISGSLEKAFNNGFFAKVAYNYGVARNTVDPGSIASGTWIFNEQSGDPNNPGVGFSTYSPGHRAIAAVSYKRDIFGIGPTSLSLFGEYVTQGTTSYRFAGDMNGDGSFGNDLIYIPRDASEMNFQEYKAAGRTFTVADQKTAWEAYIQQDSYLSANRGKYAERNAVFLPMVLRGDISVTQDIARSFGRKRNSLQLRLDILNFTNMINHEWGVGQRVVTNQPLVARGADASGAAIYELRNIGPKLLSTTFQNTVNLEDVYRMQLSLRYFFN